MFPKSTALALTLVFTLTLALAFATLSDAKAYDRRDHGSFKRLIKKRSPQVLANPIAVAPSPTAAPPASPPANPATSPVDPPVVSNPPPAAPSAPPPASPAPPAATAANPVATAVGIVNSVVNTVAATAVASQPLAVASVTTAPSVVPTTALPTSVPPPSPTTEAPKVTAAGGKSSSRNIVTLTSEVSAASATKTGVPARNAAMQKTVTTVLIVIASVVGGTAIIWTIIRKWKFSPSNSFEDRMQPIDWQPTNEETGLPPSRRISNASSFHSAGHGDNMAGYGHGGGYGSTSDYGHGYGLSDQGHGSSDLGHNVAPTVAPLQPLPDHDFTAAPSTNLAPIGGYADLARGPSPGPQMQEAYRGHVGYPSYDASQDAYDYNGGTRY